MDKHYDPVTQTNVMNIESVLPDFIQTQIRPHYNISFETLCMIDSTEITDNIRNQIVSAIESAPSDQVIITHGTDTMAETAQFLEGKTPPNKTVILTGSMIPMKEFAMSDAGFNIGFAIAQAASLSAGVYLCMHGQVFCPSAVTKDTGIARFKKR